MADCSEVQLKNDSKTTIIMMDDKPLVDATKFF